jgi:serine/threonine-protein kinase
MPRRNVCILFVFVSVVNGQVANRITTDIEEGLALQSAGRFSEAERDFISAVSIAEAAQAPAGLRVTALSNLASIQVDLTRLDDAARTYERALQILRKDSPHSINRIRTLQTQMSELYLEAEQYATAEKLVRKILYELPEGDDPSAKAYALDVLASAYSHRKKFAAAEAAERESLSIMSTLKDVNPASFAIGTLHLSNFLNLRNRPADALPYANRAMDLFAGLALPQPGMHASAQINLASIYSRLGRRTEAETTAQAAIEEARHHYGADHPKTALMLLARAAVLRAIGERQAAREAQKQGEQILAKRPEIDIVRTVPIDALLPR